MNRKDRRAAAKQGKGRAQSGTSADGGAIFAAAVRHHQAGQLLEAERLYREIIAIDPRHIGTLHYLSIIALQTGRPAAAVELIGRALAVNDALPECHYNMAFALHELRRFDEAVAHYRRATELKPDYVEAHGNLGNLLKEQGNLTEAVACYEHVLALKPGPEAHYNIANAYAQQGRPEEAAEHYRRALALKPDFLGALNNLANALVAQGKPDEAVSYFQRALAIEPNFVEGHVNFGNLLAGQGRIAEAEAQLRHALGITDNFALAHSNLGNVLLAQGRADEALVHLRRAVALNPDLADAQNNLGIALAAQGKLDEAGACFEQALRLKPDHIDGYNNLARVFWSKGLPDQALGVLRRALSIRETRETKKLFVQCARNLGFVPDVDDFRNLVVRALTEPWCQTSEIAGIATVLVVRDPAIRPTVERVMSAWPNRLPEHDLLGPSGLAELSQHRLFRSLLECAPISNIELERFLTAARFALLQRAAGERSDGDEIALGFCCTLARQCFLNEYVFVQTEAETEQVRHLRDRLVRAIQLTDAIPELWLAVVGAYIPLALLPMAATLLERPWSAPVTELLVQQVREPLEEQQLRATMPVLTPIEDRVSQLVRQQYEENPYPRWVKADPGGRTGTVDQYLRGLFPSAEFRPLGKAGGIDVLIAGCGTGQHALGTAQRFQGARVLAIDLSLASLGYAKRKTLATGLSNIDFAQADILNLSGISRTFDIIESSGVLHHMGDPFAGWRALLSLLRPGGFMAVGLYSERARADLAPARAFIARRGYQSTPEDIRRCRHDLLQQADEAMVRRLLDSVDFFTTSECRDLLFHVQEHRMTLPQIAAFVAENDLAFLGFELDAAVNGRYHARFPADRTMTDLDSWHVFETENPKTFAGMYQFWVQKKPPR
jgi:tetratricopeptide (TPR) repeat protein/SAM-dependent methyltransferase